MIPLLFKNALVRPPGANFASGLTNAAQGPPDLHLALAQHGAYCDALKQCGLTIACLPDIPDFPDGTFVEDTAVLLPDLAIITRPGAPSRRGETGSVEAALAPHFANILRLDAPGTLDGGDVCAVDDHFFIGISARTNEHGAEQLACILTRAGFGTTRVDIRRIGSLLHLKSGITYLGDGRLILAADAPRIAAFDRYDLILLRREENYAANCLAINGTVLLADGYPELAAIIDRWGLKKTLLNMSEFRKMDGGLTCLSLRF